MPGSAKRPEPNPDKKKQPAKKPAKKSNLSKEENQVFNQMSSDIKKEGKANPKQLKALTQQVAEDQFKEDALTGLAHPDAQALIKAGVPEAQVKELTAKYAPTHPANAFAAAQSGSTKGTGVTADPSSPSQYAADVLIEAGLPDTASNEKLLESQMTVEGMPGNENNPLATSLQEAGSKSVNSDGVQDYPSLAEGAQAEASTLKQNNMASIFNALKSGNATPNQYAEALANSSYEGSDPSANEVYAQSFLADSGEPESAWPTSIAQGGGSGSSGGSGGTIGAGLSSLPDSSFANDFTNLSSIFGSGIGTAGSQASSSSVQDALASLSTSPQSTLTANTSNAPGSPDQTPSQAQQTAVNPAAQYQAALAALLPNIKPGGTNG